MACPMCGSPRPEERRRVDTDKTTLCVDDFHIQLSDSEERERVLPAEY